MSAFMKITGMVVAALAAITPPVFAQDEPLDSPPSTATRALRRETSETLAAARGLAAEKTAELRARAEKRLRELEPQIAELKERARKATGDMRARLSDEIGQLETKRADLHKRFDAWTTSSKEAWGDMKVGFEEALDDLDRAYEKAKSRFK